ncbi:MAG: alpha/beta hydrolase [Candidatus Tectomicrobia bacterium]|uniref:Alpha/beta hydrolase n=1 Tax=Tectimicrobiota bacterium TaxID=2528274 RepID=A0A932GQH2_UNCTE|nr:alpha/beta hydrolase [Candidatus Tectomicrobia bacterium]
MMRDDTEKKVQRWQEQRWLLDHIVNVVGLDWDQGRTRRILANCGAAVGGDLRAIGQRVKKFNDIGREFARGGQRRQEMGEKAEREGYLVTARENYFIAAQLFCHAQWPLFEDDNPQKMAWEEDKDHCYDKYIAYADHRIERVEVPFEGKSLSGLLHLPREVQGKVPAILGIPGMDSVKEEGSLYGDSFLERGLAVLRLDGPGQGTSNLRKIRVTATNYAEAGTAALELLARRPEVDPERIAIFGVSMGSYWGTLVGAAAGNRVRAIAVANICLEPGMNSLFEKASPTFKLNYMYMTGYQDEEEFNRFARTLDAREAASRITTPYLVLAGEDDELCPIEHVYRHVEGISVPKTLIVCEGEKHSIANPHPRTYVADWLKDRMEGKPARSEKIYVKLSGEEVVTPL